MLVSSSEGFCRDGELGAILFRAEADIFVYLCSSVEFV